MIDTINQEVTMFISYLRNEEIMKYNDDWIHEDSGIQICLDDFKLPKHLRNITTLENSMYCVVWNSIIKIILGWNPPSISLFVFQPFNQPQPPFCL